MKLENYTVRLILNVAIIVAAWQFFGCKTTEPLAVPAGCEDSVIYRELAGGKEVCSVINIANAGALLTEAYRVEDARAVVAAIRSLVDGTEPITYTDFIAESLALVHDLNQKYKVLLLVITQEVEFAFKQEIPICRCDRDLISGCLKRIDRNLDIMTEG